MPPGSRGRRLKRSVGRLRVLLLPLRLLSTVTTGLCPHPGMIDPFLVVPPTGSYLNNPFISTGKAPTPPLFHRHGDLESFTLYGTGSQDTQDTGDTTISDGPARWLAVVRRQSLERRIWPQSLILTGQGGLQAPTWEMEILPKQGLTRQFRPFIILYYRTGGAAKDIRVVQGRHMEPARHR